MGKRRKRRIYTCSDKILCGWRSKSHFGEGLWNGPSRTLFPDIPINLLKLLSSQGIVGEKSFVASR